MTQFEKEFIKMEGLSRKRNPFNDERLDSIHEELSEQMSKHQSIVIQEIATDNAEAVQFYRFLGNEKVTVEELIHKNCQISPSYIKDRELLCISDSSAFNMKSSLPYLKTGEQFGVLQDGKTPGFHAHASLALDATDGSVIGLSDLILWNRPADKSTYDTSTKQNRENYKWLLGATNSHKVLQTASGVNFLFDREADDFELMAHIQNTLQSDFTIRVQHNRNVKYEGQSCSLSQCLSNLCVALVYNLELSKLDHYCKSLGKRKKRKAREATIELRFAQVDLSAPKHLNLKTVLSLSIVEAREVTPDLPKGEKPLHWKIWTNKPITNAQQALQVVHTYVYRWCIEQLFRTMKKKGFNQEATQLGCVSSIVKQTAITFKQATKVMQLVQAREQTTVADQAQSQPQKQYQAQPIEVLFDPMEQQVLKKVNELLEGKTEKLKNPYPPKQLSFASWIIARLGGWKGYQSQKPPGPITMKQGLDKFKMIYQGYLLFDTT